MVFFGHFSSPDGQTDTRTRKMAGREDKNRSYSSGSGKKKGAQFVRQSQAPVNICRLGFLLLHTTEGAVVQKWWW